MKPNNKEIQVLEKEITPVVSKATKITITSKNDMVKATEVLSTINKYADTVKEKKETITKPLNLALKNARLMFAPLEEKLDSAITAIRSAMTSYQTEQVKIQKEEELRIASRIGAGKGKITIETAVKKLDQLDKPQEEIATESGLVKFRTVQKFRIIDQTKIPHEFLIPNEIAIKKAMNAGITIAGIEYFEEQIPLNYR